MPPSICQLEAEKRAWTTAEVHHLVKLQEKLRGEPLRIRVRDFHHLWEVSEGRCALTGTKFGATNEFDVGIDVIQNRKDHRRFDVDNLRLVLLPLAYSRARARRYSFKTQKIPDLFAGRLAARAIILSFIERLKENHLAKTYAVDGVFDHGHVNNPYVLSAPVFPVTRFHRKNGHGNAVEVMQVWVDDQGGVVRVNGYKKFDEPQVSYGVRSLWHHHQLNLPLSDPTIDFTTVLVEMFECSFQSSLTGRAAKILEEWIY